MKNCEIELNNTSRESWRMHRTYIATDMAKHIFWTCTLILCTQSLISLAEGTVETSLIDPFEVGRIDTSVGQETKEWIDPFDMTRYSHAEKRMVKGFHSNEVCENCHCERDSMEKNFLQRLVNLLINHSQNGEETFILLRVTSNQLQNLYHLDNAANSEATIRVLNGIFSDMTVHDKPSFMPNFIMDIFISEEIWSNVAAMSFAILPLCVFIMGGTTRRIMLILSLAVFGVSYFKTQKLMLKKLEVENEHTFMKQTECSPREWSWFNIFGSSNDVECLKVLQAQRIDPSLEVTPIKVISHMIAVGLFQPMEHFGVAFSHFSNQIFESHSWLKGMLVFTVAAFIVIYVVTVCLAGIFGRSFTIGNKHLSLGITGSPENCAERRPASIEPALETQVATKSNAIINHGHSIQPVIQIIHNYPSKHVDVPVATNDDQIKHVVPKKDMSNTSEMKLPDSLEESHKIHVITPDSSSTKEDTSKINESEDAEKK